MSQITVETEKALRLLDLEYKKGNNYFLLSCPFASDPKSPHKNGDTNPSFVIYPQYDICKCFGCGLRFKLHEFFENVSKFQGKTIDLEYIDTYVDWSFIEEEEDTENYHIDDVVLGMFEKYPDELRYLENRGIDRSYIPFDIFYDPDFQNVLAPIRLSDGTLIGATGRNVNKRQHHHYFKVKTTKCLLGLERQDASRAIIVEGLTDFLNLYSKITELQLDYNVYATLTASLSEWQARELVDMSKPIYLAWDCDEPGTKAKEKHSKKLLDAYALYDCNWNFKNEDGTIKDAGDLSIQDVATLFG